MELFSNEYILDSSLANQAHKMAVFIAVWHGPNFLCSLASAAPSHDMEYFYDMLNLSEMDDSDFCKIGFSVADSIQRHSCYLKAPQVIFALFNEESSPTGFYSGCNSQT